jgi:hypothetical protein
LVHKDKLPQAKERDASLPISHTHRAGPQTDRSRKSERVLACLDPPPASSSPTQRDTAAHIEAQTQRHTRIDRHTGAAG